MKCKKERKLTIKLGKLENKRDNLIDIQDENSQDIDMCENELEALKQQASEIDEKIARCDDKICFLKDKLNI